MNQSQEIENYLKKMFGKKVVRKNLIDLIEPVKTVQKPSILSPIGFQDQLLKNFLRGKNK